MSSKITNILFKFLILCVHQDVAAKGKKCKGKCPYDHLTEVNLLAM